MDEFLEKLKQLCAEYNAKIETCSCCGLTIYVGDEVRNERDTEIDKDGIG